MLPLEVLAEALPVVWVSWLPGPSSAVPAWVRSGDKLGVECMLEPEDQSMLSMIASSFASISSVIARSVTAATP